MSLMVFLHSKNILREQIDNSVYRVYVIIFTLSIEQSALRKYKKLSRDLFDLNTSAMIMSNTSSINIYKKQLFYEKTFIRQNHLLI